MRVRFLEMGSVPYVFVGFVTLLALTAAIGGLSKKSSDGSDAYERQIEVRIGLSRMPRALNLDQIFTIEDYEVLSKIHLSLVTQDSAGKIFPGLARKWSVKNNGKEFHFLLRENLSFANGNLATCKDVESTLNFLKSKKDESLWAIAFVESIVCKSDFELVLNLTQTSPFFLSELSDLRYSIRNSEDLPGAPPHLSGIGAFSLVDNSDDRIILKSKPSHYLTSSLSPQMVTYSVPGSLEKVNLLLKEGKLDLFPFRSLLVKQDDYLVSSSRKDRVWMLVVSQETFSNYPSLAACLTKSLDRHFILSEMNDGSYSATADLIPIGNESPSSALKPAGLSDVNFKCRDSRKREIRLMAMETVDERILGAIQTELERIGLRIKKLEKLTKETFNSAFGKNTYDLAVYSIGITASSVSDLAFFYFKNPSFPPSQWTSPELSLLTKNLIHVQSDREALELTAQILNMAAKKSPLIPLFFENERYLASRCIKVVEPDRFRLNQQFATIARKKNCLD